MSEFDRLFEAFQKRSPQEAALWMTDVADLGVLEEIEHLALAYQRQNKEIHNGCVQCRHDVPCEYKQREINWIARGGPWCFNFTECEISGPVSDAAWDFFAVLLSCSEHACEREKVLPPGYHLKCEELWDPDGAEWHKRLAERFAPVRQPTAKDGHRPIEGYAACR